MRCILRDNQALEMANLKDLPPAALKAAMQGGIDVWGEWGSAEHHVRYAQKVRPASLRRCRCGCGKRATHVGMANGVALMRLRTARHALD